MMTVTNTAPLSRARAKKTKHTPASATEAVCVGMTDGRTVCEVLQSIGVPKRTYWMWMRGNPALAELYNQALAVRSESFAEELVRLADSAPATAEGVAKAKLMVNTRQWVISRLLPKKYGDKIEQTVIGEPPRTVDVNLEALSARIKKLLASPD